MASPTPIELKAAGRRPQVTLSRLTSASITPAESDSLTKRWCLHPDEPDKELAEADLKQIQKAFEPIYDAQACECIQRMHRKFLEATGSGSWPPGKQCHPSVYPHDGFHATQLFIEHEQFLSNSSINRKVTDEEWQEVVVDARVWPTVDNPVKSVKECKRTFVYGGERVAAFDRPEWAQRSGRKNGQPFTMFDMSTWLTLEATRRAGCLYIEVFTGSDGDHNVHEIMKAIPGGTSGFAYFNNGSCGDHVTSNIDSLLTYSLGRLTGLRTHEFGHTLSLPHEFNRPQSDHRSMMSYAQDNTPFQGYRLSGVPYMYVEDHSWDRLRRFFGGEASKPIILPEDPTDPTDPTDPDDPPKPPTPVDLVLVYEGELRRFKEIK